MDADDIEAVELLESAAGLKREEMEALVEKLKKDHETFMRLKNENKDLRDKLGGLTKNNDELVKLVKRLEQQDMRVLPGKGEGLLYSFQAGEMVKREDVESSRIELKKKTLTLQDINDQLNEIVSIMERKRKNI